MLVRTMVVGALLSSFAGCDGSDAIDCSTAADCLQGAIRGTCVPSPSSAASWCAFSDPDCAGSATRWGIKSGDGLAGTCVEGAQADAGQPDGAPGVPAFDVVYVDEWRETYDVPLSGGLVIINMGASPIDFLTLHVKYVDDNHPTIAALPTLHVPPNQIMSGDAVGLVSAEAKSLINPLYTEFHSDEMTDVLLMKVEPSQNATYDMKVELTLQLDGVDVSLPMTIHHLLGPATLASPVHAVRVHAFR